MQDTEIIQFEMEVKHILDWSNIDKGTRDVLQHLMVEVAALAEKMQSHK